jgi:glucose/arabinose dehydrogenase
LPKYTAMKNTLSHTAIVLVLLTAYTACAQTGKQQQSDTLPPPFATAAVHNESHVIGWPAGKTPVAPAGFTVTKFADGMDNPRWIYVLPNKDILVACAGTGSSANIILLFRGVDSQGRPMLRDTFLTDLNRPFGMLLLGNKFYQANTDGLYIYPYQTGQTKMTAKGKKILDLPAGGYNNHWTRNLIANADGSKIYVTVGSGSNVAEHGIAHEVRRADILEINPDGSGERVYASGLRNPVGMGWAPGTHTLWTAVNERDNLGDDLVPDYMTSVKDGGFYGWPFSYFGQHLDPRITGKEQRPDLVKKAIVPDVPLGAHTASLGLAFYTGAAFPAHYRDGAFIGQHGSWNRSQLAGYKVAFVPFKNGKPAGKPEDFLTGFIANASKSEVYGRPVGVTVLPDGSLLVADDAAGVIWRVSANK